MEGRRTSRDAVDSVGAWTATLHFLCSHLSEGAVVVVQIAYKARQCENILWYTAVLHIEMRCHGQRVRAEAWNVIRTSL